MDDDATDIIKARLQFYEEETKKMETLFKTLSIMRSANTVPPCPSGAPRPYNCKFEVEKLNKASNYVDKMKVTMKTYKELNAKLSKEIDMWKTSLDSGDQQVNRLKSNRETIMKLQKDIERYEGNLTAMKKKHVWLQESTFSLINLQKEIVNLKALRLTRDKLMEDLAKYDDLKPDLIEASQQLAEHQRIAKKNYKSYLNSFDNLR